MDDFFEVLLEEVLEGVLDGIDSASTSNRLPAGLRIFFAVLLFGFFGVVFGLMVFVGIMLIKDDGAVLPGVMMFAIAAGILGYLIWKIRKILNRLG